MCCGAPGQDALVEQLLKRGVLVGARGVAPWVVPALTAFFVKLASSARSLAVSDTVTETL